MRLLLGQLGPLLLVLLLGAGCGGTDASKAGAEPDRGARPTTLAGGTCWDDTQLPEALGKQTFDAWVKKYAGGKAALAQSMRDDAAFSSPVTCSEPHALELYGVVEVRPSLTARVKDYAQLLDQGSALYRAIRDQVNDRCLADSTYGAAQRRAGGVPVQLGPSLNARSGLHVAWDPFPADLWEKGQKGFVCTFEQDRPGTLRFADLATSKVPAAARVCLDTPKTYLPCSGRHQAEDIGEMILNTAIEQRKISGRQAVRTGPRGQYVALTDAEYARLDKVCEALLSSVSTRKGGVAARAYPGSVSQWPTSSGAYVASCFALKPDVTPLPSVSGTVFDRE